MKRVNNLYESCYDINNIFNVANRVCTRVKNKDKVDNFEMYKSEHIINIHNRLKNMDKNLGKYNVFMITDPKFRVVMSQEIEDKILNHLIAEYILAKVFEPRFPSSMAATRIGKGTKYGIYLTKRYMTKLCSLYDNFYVLKIDIKKYFYRIDHEILKKVLSRKIKDKRALIMLSRIIDSTDEDYVNYRISTLKKARINYIKNAIFISNKEKMRLIDEVEAIPTYEKGKGCPIGDQTSQAFGLIYLYEFNEYLKKDLKLKYVINYMDDFVVFHHDKDYLKKVLEKIKIILKRKYKLDINEKKTKIDGINSGIEFLGHRFYLKNKKIIIRLRNNTKKRFKNRIKEIRYLFLKNVINKKEYYDLLLTNKGFLKWGNCGGLFYNNTKI